MTEWWVVCNGTGSGDDLSGGEYGRAYFAAAGGDRGVTPSQSFSMALADALQLSTGGIVGVFLVSGGERTARAQKTHRNAV